MEKNRIIMRKETMKALAWMLPAIILVIGGTLWSWASIENDADPLNIQSHKELGNLGRIMALCGGAVFVLAILSNWSVRLLKFYRERKASAKDALNIHTKNRRSSSRRRHRRNHRGPHGQNGQHGHRSRATEVYKSAAYDNGNAGAAYDNADGENAEESK
jgi:hypothetical protein